MREEHPAFPAPSVFEGHGLARLGQNRPRECKGMSFSVIARSASDEAIQPNKFWIASLALAMTKVV